eukprot:gene9684-1890_t
MYRPITQAIAPANPSASPTTVPFLQPQTPTSNKRTQRSSGTATQNRKKKKPKIEESTLPQEIPSLVPESLVFQDLEKLEKKIDDFINQKKIQMKHLLAETKMSRHLLRVFIFNETSKEGEWNLHLQGQLLDENGNPQESGKPFTSFLSKVYIEFDKTAFPKESPIEWKRSQNFKDVDGFSLSRNNKQEGPLKIFLHLKPDPPRFYPSKELLDVFEFDETSYSLNSILHRVWNYIKYHKLQDFQDKKMINCDSKLIKLFGGSDRINFYDIISKIKEYLIPVEAIEIDYNIMLNDKNEIFLDISIEMEDPVQSEITSFISDEPTKDIQELNTNILQGIQKIGEHKKKREMLLEFSEKPVEFMDKLIFSQTRDLMMINNHKDKENARNSSYFDAPWIQEAMEKYLERKP